MGSSVTPQLVAACKNIKKTLEKAGYEFSDKEIKEDLDNVNHPSHYETGNFECIDVMIETQGKEAVMDFCICNAFKYIYRHNNKNGIEDVKKAKWYLDKYIELSEK